MTSCLVEDKYSDVEHCPSNSYISITTAHQAHTSVNTIPKQFQDRRQASTITFTSPTSIINTLNMHFIKTIALAALLQVACALPKPAGTTTDVDMAAMGGTVCNCANMQGVDNAKSLFGINQCTILVINNTFRCALDSNRQLGYECPNLNGTPNCNACAQSLDSSRLGKGNSCPGTPAQGFT